MDHDLPSLYCFGHLLSNFVKNVGSKCYQSFQVDNSTLKSSAKISASCHRQCQAAELHLNYYSRINLNLPIINYLSLSLKHSWCSR